MKKILEELHLLNIEIKENIDLTKFTYLQTGGIAKLLLLPKDANEVMQCIDLLKTNNVKYKVIGATSNIMFLDNTDYSCLISTINLKGIKIDQKTNEIVASSGEMLGDLSRYALLNSITGFEGLEGIPGTIGGAIFMNAGAYGYETKNVLKSIDLIDSNGKLVSLNNEDLGLKYRNSNLKNGTYDGIVVSARFSIKSGNQNKIEEKMELFHAKRHKYQEMLYPNLGSCFSGSVYRGLGKKDSLFKYVSMFYFLFNYEFKIFRRESPLNRKWINDLAIKRFNFCFEKQPFSNKNINTLVNRGQGTDEMIRYINEINKLTDNKIPVENEIVEGF